MISASERLPRAMRGRSCAVHLALVLAASSLAGCGLTRPEPPPPFDCAAIDRAEERFPDACGAPEPEDEDAGVEAAGDDDGGAS